MFGINLQLFNSKLRISIFVTKKLHFAQIAQENCAKLKFCFMRNFRKKYFRFCANFTKKIAQNSLHFMRKNSAKVRKKNLRENSANFAQKI